MVQFSLLSGEWDLEYSRPYDPQKYALSEGMKNGVLPTDDQLKPPAAMLTLRFERRCPKPVLEKLIARVQPGLKVENSGGFWVISTDEPDAIKALLSYAVYKEKEVPGFTINANVEDRLVVREETLFDPHMKASAGLKSLVVATGLTPEAVGLLVKDRDHPLPDDMVQMLEDCSKSVPTLRRGSRR